MRGKQTGSRGCPTSSTAKWENLIFLQGVSFIQSVPLDSRSSGLPVKQIHIRLPSKATESNESSRVIIIVVLKFWHFLSSNVTHSTVDGVGHPSRQDFSGVPHLNCCEVGMSLFRNPTIFLFRFLPVIKVHNIRIMNNQNINTARIETK